MWKRNCCSLGADHPNALAVGDEAVHRDAHRVDQHGFKLVAPERRTMIVMTLTGELDIGALLPSAACSAIGYVTDRETTLIVVGGPSDRTAIAGAPHVNPPQSEPGTPLRKGWAEH